MSARTLKIIFFTLLILGSLANLSAYGLYGHSQPAALAVMGIFDLLFVIPVALVFGLYAILVTEGQKVKTDTLTSDLFKGVQISQK
jgi:hypothetical protein